MEQIRLIVFDWYVTHYDSPKPHISFCQFWDDFLLNHIISEDVPIEQTYQKTCDKLKLGKEQKELSNG